MQLLWIEQGIEHNADSTYGITHTLDIPKPFSRFNKYSVI